MRNLRRFLHPSERCASNSDRHAGCTQFSGNVHPQATRCLATPIYLCIYVSLSLSPSPSLSLSLTLRIAVAHLRVATTQTLTHAYACAQAPQLLERPAADRLERQARPARLLAAWSAVGDYHMI